MWRKLYWGGVVCVLLFSVSCHTRRIRSHSSGSVHLADTLQAKLSETARSMQADSCRERFTVRLEQVVFSEPDSSGRQHVHSVQRMLADRQTESGRQTEGRDGKHFSLDRAYSENGTTEAVRETHAVVPSSGLRLLSAILACAVAFVLLRKFRGSR